MTGSSPTKAGNYLDRYEYINTVSPEANDPYFVKNVDKISHIRLQYTATSSIEAILMDTPGRHQAVDYRNAHRVAPIGHTDYGRPDRTYLTASTRNRTRIRTRFSNPGGFETLSRGYLDPEHETFSPNNAMTFKNAWQRKVYNSQLQAHMGRFGTSTHGPYAGATFASGAVPARIFGNEKVGQIRSADYLLVGDASRHKYHRNNLERIELSGSSVDTNWSTTTVTASVYDNAFVSHMIPRTDQQVRWITSSINLQAPNR